MSSPSSGRFDNPEMTIRTIEPAQQTAAKVAGLAYLITFAAVVYVNFGIHDRLIVENDAETARNILAHERFFRIGIAGDLVYCVGVVVLLTALLRDSQAGQSGPRLVGGILEARLGLDVACHDTQSV